MDIKVSSEAVLGQLENEFLEAGARIARWKESQYLFGGLLKDLEGTPLNYTPYWDNDLNISILGTGDELVRVWRAIRRAGFALASSPPKSNDSYWTGFFTNEETPARIFLSFSSTVCKRVKVGTKTVEVDEYETICDGVSSNELI